MGTRHSTRRDWSFDSSGGAGYATTATGKSSHRLSTSSGTKLRSPWSKVGRSHSDRTSAKLAAKQRGYGDLSGANNLQDYSPVKGCSSVTVACQTEVQFVAVMTQTDSNEGLKMTDVDHGSFASDSFSNQPVVGNGSNIDFCDNCHCRIPNSCRLHNVSESFRHLRLTAKSCSMDNEHYSRVVCNGNHMKERNCSTDASAKCSETDKDMKYSQSAVLVDNVKHAVNDWIESESKLSPVETSSRCDMLSLYCLHVKLYVL